MVRRLIASEIFRSQKRASMYSACGGAVSLIRTMTLRRAKLLDAPPVTCSIRLRRRRGHPAFSQIGFTVSKAAGEHPGAGRTPLPAIERNHMVNPGQSCSQLQDLRVTPGLGKGPRVAKIAEAKALHPGKLVAEILGEPIYHLGSPALGGVRNFVDLGLNLPK